MSIAIGIGWWIGWGIGVVVVLLAAVLLVAVIGLARRITRQGEDITAGIDRARENTGPLFALTRTNFALDRIARDLRVVRTGEPDEPRRARADPAGRAGPVEALHKMWEERGP